MARRRSVQSFFAVAGILLAIGLVGAVAAYATTKGRRQAQARDAITSLLDARSFHTSLELLLQLPSLPSGRQRPVQEVAVNVEGDAVRREAGMEFTGQLHGEARGAGTVLFTDGDLRLLSDATAFRLSVLPSLLRSSGALVNKWTYVKAPVLAMKDSSAVSAALFDVVAGSTYIGRESKADFGSLHRYVAHVSLEQEEKLARVLSSEVAGSQAWEALAFLLDNLNVKSVEFWVDRGDDELRIVEVTFIEESSTPEPAERARLLLSFTDFDTQVVVERPPQEQVARPEAFRSLFNSSVH
jgi:hypothetical protein